jgi:hypothetical protein
MKYEIQTWSIFGGWQNSWLLDDQLQTFDSYIEAHSELKDFIDESERLVSTGELEEPFSWDDYRIAEVEKERAP